MRVKGPDSELKQSILDMETKKPKKVLEISKPSPSSGRQRKSFEQKEPGEYNCNDFWYVFKALWDRAKWVGRPTPFTGKDRRQMKLLIQEQGADVVHQYFQYTFANWKLVCKNFNIRGMPSVSVLYGYRRSILPEALNGTGQAGWGSEYEDTGESEGWG